MKMNQKALTTQGNQLMLERPVIDMVRDARELTKELNAKVQVIRQAIADDDEALRIEINRVADLNKERMDEIFRLDDEYELKRKKVFNNR